MYSSATVVFAMTFLVACSDSSRITALPDDRYEIRGDGNCVHDAVTELSWERKTDAAGLRDWRNTYSWYDPDESAGELDYRGTENGGSCTESACDTWHYVNAVNSAELCGYSDWRLPTRDELLSINDPARALSPPTVNLVAFPHSQNGEYWSANDYSFRQDAAWAWNFRYGHDRVDWKKAPKALRLVRGNASKLESVRE